jgi:hypothetical protein
MPEYAPRPKNATSAKCAREFSGTFPFFLWFAQVCYENERD